MLRLALFHSSRAWATLPYSQEWVATSMPFASTVLMTEGFTIVPKMKKKTENREGK